MDIGSSTAEIVERTAAGRPIYISLVSVNDVGRFVAAALELDITSWPGEFRMAAERISVTEILQWAEAIKGGKWPSVSTLRLTLITLQEHSSPPTSSKHETFLPTSSMPTTTKTTQK